jgi:RNA polymerase sigma-70 factor, ECF subfamily
METFGPRTLAYLDGLVGPDAEDVQQDVWLSVYRRIGELADAGSFRTWLFRVTRHRAIDLLRKRKRERDLLESAAEEITEMVEADDGETTSIDDATLQRALAGMPPPQREVLLLRYRDDLSYAEIAVVVGCPIGTVRTRLHHARKRLNAILTGETS